VKRTYILGALVLICIAYIWNKRHTGVEGDLATAREKIAHLSQQPTAHKEIAPGQPPALRQGPAPVSPDTKEGSSTDAFRPSAGDGEKEKVVHLVKGTFTVVEGAIIYGADAQLDIGHGILVSSPTGVMVSDADQQHIAGDLVIETLEATTTTENAFLSVDGTHVEMTSDHAVTVKKDAPQ
jgi:hypothetical protein